MGAYPCQCLWWISFSALSGAHLALRRKAREWGAGECVKNTGASASQISPGAAPWVPLGIWTLLLLGDLKDPHVPSAWSALACTPPTESSPSQTPGPQPCACWLRQSKRAVYLEDSYCLIRRGSQAPCSGLPTPGSPFPLVDTAASPWFSSVKHLLNYGKASD